MEHSNERTHEEHNVRIPFEKEQCIHVIRSNSIEEHVDILRN